MKKKLFIAALIASCAVLLYVAFAPKARAELYTGCYAQANLGYSNGANDLDVSSPLLVGVGLEINGLSTDGVTYGGQLGCDKQVDKIVIGLFGSYTWSEADWQTIVTLPGASANLAWEMGESWTLGVRAGVLVNPSTLLYVGVGYTETDTSDINLTTTGLGGFTASIPVQDLTGVTWLGGVETHVSGNVFAGLEVRYTDYDTESLALVPGFVNADLEASDTTVYGTLKIKFGPTVGEIEPLKLQ